MTTKTKRQRKAKPTKLHATIRMDDGRFFVHVGGRWIQQLEFPFAIKPK